MFSVVNDSFTLVTNVCVSEKQDNIRPEIMKTKKCPQALMKKQVEDNLLACVASKWIRGSSVNARLQSIKNGEIPDG